MAHREAQTQDLRDRALAAMEALGAINLHLTQTQLEALEAAIPVGAAAGARYPEALLVHMDSERSRKSQEEGRSL